MKKIITVLLFFALFLAVGLIAQESDDVSVDVGDLPTQEADATATDTPAIAPTRTITQTGIGGISQAYEAGAEALNAGNEESAISFFQNAVTIADQFLSGIVDPSDEAQTKYFKGLALYYSGKLTKNDATLDEASSALGEAVSAFTALDRMGRIYLDAKYRRGLCSFRQYQIARTDVLQVRKLSQAYGDFLDFLDDPALDAERDQMVAEIEEATYFAALCLLHRGMIRTFDPSEHRSARTDFTTAAGYFSELVDARNQQISIISRLMEGITHYQLARLYMQVSPDNWGTANLSNKERDAAILEELQTADSRLNAAKGAVGAFAAAAPYMDYAILHNSVARGAAGETIRLRESLETLASISASGAWAQEKDALAANAQLLRYFSGEAPFGAAVNGWTGLTSRDKMANFWIGWVRYIESIGDTRLYPQAATQFGSFLASSDVDTRDKIMRADARFREAECVFWEGTLRENNPMLREAQNIYQSLISSSGAYFRYLPEDIIRQAEIRIQIIDVQSRLAAGESDINRVIAGLRTSGLELPEHARAYLNFGKYFLQKANREAGDKRLGSVNLAIGLFDRVSKSPGVGAEIVQEANFLKGVGHVKKAPASPDAERPSIMQEARSILGSVTGALATEAKYAIGVGYFNIEDRASARTALDGFKDSYIRPAFVFGMSSDACVTRGTYLRKVTASTDRTDPWHLRASVAFEGLECRASVPPQDATLRPIGAPITYEELADESAQMAELRAEGILIWQKVAPGMKHYPIDDLIPDMPPKTTIAVQFEIVETDGKKITGDHSMIIGGDSEIADKIDGSTYRATINRGTHVVEVNLRGYYKYSEEHSITEDKTIQLVLRRAVRYVRHSSDVENSQQPMAIASRGDHFFLASNERRAIYRRDSGGKLIGSIFYDDIGVSAVTGLTLDGDYLLIVDGRGGQIKLATIDGSDIQPIAVKGESYGGKRLLKPSGAVAVDGRYYIVDAGNGRVIEFEGVNYRNTFGAGELERPMGIAFRESDGRFLVTDLVQGKIFVYSRTGDLVESFALTNLKSPSSIFVDPDGFILVSDYVGGAVYKYTNRFEFIGEVSSDAIAPVAMAQIGSGPDATLYIAERDAVAVLRGAWDNAYMPSR